MKLDEFEIKIKDWSKARGILDNSNISSQWLKLVSEVGELADNLIKGNSIEDDIGDCMVLLTNIKNMSNDNNDDMQSKSLVVILMLKNMINMYLAKDNTSDIKEFTGLLSDSAILNGTTLEKSCETAYNDIKDRKGFMNKGGVFIKNTDENYEKIKNKDK